MTLTTTENKIIIQEAGRPIAMIEGDFVTFSEPVTHNELEKIAAFTKNFQEISKIQIVS